MPHLDDYLLTVCSSVIIDTYMHQIGGLAFHIVICVCVCVCRKACRCVCACVCVCIHTPSVFLWVCFCSVSICREAIHQSVDSTAHRITFPLPSCIPLIFPFYLTPSSLSHQDPPYLTSSLSPTQSAILAFIMTRFCH